MILSTLWIEVPACYWLTVSAWHFC